MTVTISDISKKLGISISTVSKALNDYADVSSETRELVQSTATEMGYHPSAAARNLRRGQTDKIGFLINTSLPFVGDYLAEIIPSLILAAENHQQNLILYTANASQPESLARISRSREVDGMILFLSNAVEETIQIFQEVSLPCIVLSRRVELDNVSFVAPDHFAGATLAIQHLIDLGHRRIGFMKRPELGTINVDRFGAYQTVLAKNDIPLDESLIVETYISPQSGYHAMNELLDVPNRPTAVFAFHDMVAVDALQAILDRGLRIPEDIALVGSDGNHSSLLTQPPITTVVPPFKDLAKATMDALLQHIAEPDLPPTRMILPVTLIERASTIGAK